MSERHRLVVMITGKHFALTHLTLFKSYERRREQVSQPLSGPDQRFSTGMGWDGVFDTAPGSQRSELVAALTEIAGVQGASATVESVWDFDSSTAGMERSYCYRSVSFLPYLGLDIYGQPAPFTFFAGGRVLQ